MKLLVNVVLALLVTPAAMAASKKLNALECIGNNGVTLKTQRLTKKGVTVLSTWVGLTKTFAAELTETSMDSESTVTLSDKGGDILYTISLDLNPLRSTAQKAQGYIYRPRIFAEGAPSIVTGVDCTVVLGTAN